MNSVNLVGRLTRDPEVRYTDGGSSVAKFTLACDRRFKKQGDTQTADFISCVSFGKTAEFIEKYFKQGMKMGAEGRIQTGSYENKEGAKVYTTDVIVDNVEFVDSKGADNNEQPSGQRPTPASASSDGFMNIPDCIDEEMPFN